jgi:hypothetical protein
MRRSAAAARKKMCAMMHRFQNAVAVIACVLLSVTAACQSTNPRVSDGRYTSPDGLLSVAVPKLGPGQTIEDQFVTDPKTGQHAGFVSFHDDFGSVRSITYGEIKSEIAASFEDPARAQATLRAHAREKQLPIVQQYAPHASITNEGPIDVQFTHGGDVIKGWLAVFEIPAGSTLMVRNNEHPQGRRLDTTRVSLFAFRGGVLFDVSGANDLESEKKTTPEMRALSPQELERWQRELMQIYISMGSPEPAAPRP